MAEIINVAGAALIKVGTGASAALETLGYTRDGSTIIFEEATLEVKTDLAGGENSYPEDVQHLSERARIRLEMAKWDEAIADKIRPRLLGGSVGTVGAAGSLMIAGGFTFRLVIVSTVRPLNFPITMFSEPHEINKGTKFSTWILEGIAYKAISTGVLFNATTSG